MSIYNQLYVFALNVIQSITDGTHSASKGEKVLHDIVVFHDRVVNNKAEESFERTSPLFNKLLVSW